MDWVDGPLCGLDIETIGGDRETTRIVAVALVFVGGNVPRDDLSLLVDPGVSIPTEATNIHGITTEQVRAQGIRPAEALREVADRLQRTWRAGKPIIGFNIVSDLTVLDREMRRHLGHGLTVTGPVIDPHVIDRALDRRKGPRTLEASCQHYRVRLDDAHDPTEDALAAARLAWRLAKCHPDDVGGQSLEDLHRKQVYWAKKWADSLNRYWKSKGEEKSIDGTWPLQPYVER